MRAGLVFTLLMLVVGALGCSSAKPSAPSPAGSRTEAPGGCASGTMPTLGASACAAVGPQSCGEGFEKAESGWGCAAVVPAEPCEGASRAALGSRECVPLDDCARAFPPPDADVIVDPSGGDDARVVRTLTEAIARAPRGGLIALAKGTHAGKVRVTKSVRIEGHCASDVVVEAIDDMDGFGVVNGAELSLTSMTVGRRGTLRASEGESIGGVVVVDGSLVGKSLYFRDLDTAINAGGSAVSLEESVIDGFDRKERQYVSAVSLLKGARARLANVEIRGTVTAVSADDASEATITRSVLRYYGTVRTSSLLSAHTGSTISFEDGFIGSRSSTLAFASKEPAPSGATTPPPPSRLRLSGSVLEQRGAAIDATLVTLDDSAAEIRDVSVRHQATGAFWFNKAKSASTLENVVVTVAEPDADQKHHKAIRVSEGADVTATGVAIIGPAQVGAFVDGKGARLRLARSFVTGTRFGLDGGKAPWGFGAAAIEAIDRATVDLDGSTLTSNVQFGLLAGGEATLAVRSSLFEATTASPENKWGEAIFGDGGTRVSVEDSVFRGSTDAAVCFGADSYGTISRATFEKNGVAVASEMTAIVERPAAKGAKNVVVLDSSFDNYEERFRFAPLEWSLRPDAAQSE